jgi:hypothetical protein
MPSVTGYKYDEGGVSISGSQWELWENNMGSGAVTWTYLSYLVQNPSAAPVNNLNILAFIQDAENRKVPGTSTLAVTPTWYLYSIPAGIELRTGGIPFTSNSFSVSVQ